MTLCFEFKRNPIAQELLAKSVAHESKRWECRQPKQGFLHFLREDNKRGFFLQGK
jgi:hypothetical protein